MLEHSGQKHFLMSLVPAGLAVDVRGSDGVGSEYESTKYLLSPAGVPVFTYTVVEGRSKLLISHGKILLLPL